MIPLRVLARLGGDSSARQEAAPGCELCGAALGDRHGHVVEIGKPGVQCVCTGCAILFREAHAESRFRTVPDRIVADPAFSMTARRWGELGIPVTMAFVRRDSTRAKPVVAYPGPAGVVEAELEPAAWRSILEATILAEELEPDVEALLVHGDRFTPTLACHLVPITTVYELSGRLRSSWRGFSGGDEAEAVLAELRTDLEAKATLR